MWFPVVLTVLAGYFLGNINGAVLISRTVVKEDVRGKGSGNAGLTNFLRNFGGWSFLLVVILDMGKTVLGCLIAKWLLGAFWGDSLAMMLGAIAVTIGHDFPALLNFKGGKGILCGLTIALMIDWRVALIIAVIFFSCFFATRLVSLSSILASTAFAVSFAVLWWGDWWMVAGGVFLGVLAVVMHWQNIVRLCKGQEKKFTFAKKK